MSPCAILLGVRIAAGPIAYLRVSILVAFLIMPGHAEWFKGQTHAHSNVSDGDSSPEDVARWYQQHHYDFLFLTDHYTIDDVAPLNAAFGSGGKFLVLPGQEVTSNIDRFHIHVNALFSIPIPSLKPLVPAVVGASALPILQKNLDAVNAAGGVSQINHPNFYWAVTAADIQASSGAVMMEIYSGNLNANVYGAGPAWPSAERMWDQVLSHGKKIWGVASDDLHYLKEPWASNKELPGRGWIVVRAPMLTAPEIIAAIKRGDFYASTGVEIRDYNAIPGKIQLSVVAASRVKYFVQFIGRDGQILQATEGPSAEYAIKGTEGYVRAKITASNGHVAWTQPMILAK
jgi:hypothetical protein